jgi:hypothetical protein
MLKRALPLLLVLALPACVTRTRLHKETDEAYARGSETASQAADDARRRAAQLEMQTAVLERDRDNAMAERDSLAHQIETFLRIGCRCKHKGVFEAHGQ